MDVDGCILPTRTPLMCMHAIYETNRIYGFKFCTQYTISLESFKFIWVHQLKMRSSSLQNKPIETIISLA